MLGQVHFAAYRIGTDFKHAVNLEHLLHRQVDLRQKSPVIERLVHLVLTSLVGIIPPTRKDFVQLHSTNRLIAGLN